MRLRKNDDGTAPGRAERPPPTRTGDEGGVLNMEHHLHSLGRIVPKTAHRERRGGRDPTKPQAQPTGRAQEAHSQGGGAEPNRTAQAETGRAERGGNQSDTEK